jgi:hypothetical protein
MLCEHIAERCDQRLRGRIALGPAHQHANPPRPIWLLGSHAHRECANDTQKLPPPHARAPRLTGVSVATWIGIAEGVNDA